MEEKRHITRRADDSCPHQCSVCDRYTLQMKWLIVIACMAAGMIGNNSVRTYKNEKSIAIIEQQNIIVIGSLNEIKKAMGLEVRMPPKIEALK